MSAGRRCKDLAFAIASLSVGTATAMIAVGCETHRAKELRRASLSALQLLLTTFSDLPLLKNPSGL